jgi:pyridoxine 4-dehydrogenase
VKLLGPRGRIHQFEPARRDFLVPLQETFGALRDLVAEDKIGGVALSEVSVDTIRKAAAITKIVVVEAELSLWETAPLTNGIAQACKELDIPIIA